MTKRELLVLISISVFFLFLTLNRHSKSGIFKYHSEIWADKAGYNVYLPALFIYNFDTINLPDSIDTKTGMGFSIDKKNHKIITKYPYGVALLQSPFWLIAHLFDKDKNGYSISYHKAIDVASVFYFIVGLLYLYKLFKKYTSKKNALLSLFVAIVATNLFYYAIWETGMSHIYSFSVLAIILFLLSEQIFDYRLIMLSILYIIIRPINIFFLFSIILLYDNYSLNDVKKRVSNLLTIKNCKVFTLLSIIFVLPQIMYNKYAFGSYLTYSYNNEKFDYWLNPKILEVLFAPNNGLFLYSPIILIILLFGIYNLNSNKQTLYLPTILLISYTYIYGSWWSYMLGCGFGHRGFVDILPLFIVYSYKIMLQNVNIKLILIIIILCCVYTLKLTLSYDGCFYGASDWDWEAFSKLLTNNTK